MKTKANNNIEKDEKNISQREMQTKFMELALVEAEKAGKCGEVPIGAVVVENGKVISHAHNMREKKQNATYHAELLAIDKACKKKHSWRLDDCEMYVTLEPCPMCAGAIINARIKKVIFAAAEKTSQDDLFQKIVTSNRLNHKCEFEQDETFNKKSALLLTNFFKQKRNDTLK